MARRVTAQKLEKKRTRRTGQKRKRAEAKFQGLLEAGPDAIVGIKHDGRIVLVNTQTEKLFGFTRDELLGQPVETLVPDRFFKVHVGHRLGYFSDFHTRPMGFGLELYGRRKDGSEFPGGQSGWLENLPAGAPEVVDTAVAESAN